MAILTSLAQDRITIGAIEPFSERIINRSIPEYCCVAGSTKLALVLERRIGVLARCYIFERSQKKLVTFTGSPEFIRKHSRHIRIGKSFFV